MDTGLIVGLAVVAAVVVIAVAVVLVLRPQQRSRHLKKKFGPEYDRAIDRHGDRKEAENELAAREKRHSSLELRDITPEARTRYEAEWASVQERFVDDPVTAVAEADRLMTRVMADRGYPTENPEQQAADLSVEHAGTIGHYRSAREAAERGQSGAASTEDLRTAMVHYRTLFAELLGHDHPNGKDRDHDGATDRDGDRHEVPGPRDSGPNANHQAEPGRHRDIPETR